MKIKPTLHWLVLVKNLIGLNVGSYSHQNPECANSNYENPPNTTLNWFYELNSVEK